MGHAGPVGVFLRFHHALRIDLHTHTAGAEPLRRHDDDAAIPGAQIVSRTREIRGGIRYQLNA